MNWIALNNCYFEDPITDLTLHNRGIGAGLLRWLSTITLEALYTAYP